MTQWESHFRNRYNFTGLQDKKVNVRRILLLLSTLFFYSWVILLFVRIEFPEMVTRDTIKISLIPIFYGLNWFVSCYILFTLFIPFINSFLTSLSKYRYLRLHCQDKIKSIYHTKYRNILIAALILILLGKGALEMLGVILNKPNAIITKPSLYFGEVVGIPLATIMFLTFATMKMRYNKYINMLAETVLGVYLMITNFSRRRLYGIIYSQI